MFDLVTFDVDRWILIQLNGHEADILSYPPTAVTERFLLVWQDEGIVIPWPVGIPPKQAILQWADEQRKAVESV